MKRVKANDPEWAYLPGKLSAFRDAYSYRMGVQVHEFGHNIGLHHSGYGTASYADHSCLMGNPSYGDDGPQICWNAAKVSCQHYFFCVFYDVSGICSQSTFLDISRAGNQDGTLKIQYLSLLLPVEHHTNSSEQQIGLIMPTRPDRTR